MRPITAVLAALTCSACYTYTPVEFSAVPNGTPVRARVTSEQSIRLEPLIGRSDVRLLDGILVEAGPDTVLLQVPAASRTVTGGGLQVLHQNVTIPRSGILEVELKRLNRGRTALLAAGATVVLGWFILDGLNIGPGKEKPPTDPGGPEFRLRW